MTKRVFFFVQNLLGIGHVVRAARLSQALCAAGAEVTLASGGVPVDGLDFGPVRRVDLPAIKAGPGGFSDLRLADGSPLDEAHKARRRDLLLTAFTASQADILLIEAFPFGRRAQRFELLPLLDAAKGRKDNVLIACSVRDILQAGRSAERRQDMVSLVRRYFDVVLVHGDERLIPFDLSFPEAPQIADRLAYTGIVAPPAIAWQGEAHEVIVVAGGGVVGGRLFEAAIAARALTSLSTARWLVVGGPHLPEDRFADIAARGAAQGIDVERFLPDLPARYGAARLVISQAGYNTVADILVAGTRSVLIPFASGGESEQTERARLMAEKGLAIALSEDELSPVQLADAIHACLALPRANHAIRLDGAQKSAALLLDSSGFHRAMS